MVEAVLNTCAHMQGRTCMRSGNLSALKPPCWPPIALLLLRLHAICTYITDSNIHVVLSATHVQTYEGTKYAGTAEGDAKGMWKDLRERGSKAVRLESTVRTSVKVHFSVFSQNLSACFLRSAPLPPALNCQ